MRFLFQLTFCLHSAVNSIRVRNENGLEKNQSVRYSLRIVTVISPSMKYALISIIWRKKKRKKSILYPIFCCFFRSFFYAFCLFFSFCCYFATGYLISQSKRPKTKLRLYNEWVTWFFSYYMAFCRSAHRWNAIAHLGKSNGYAGNQFLTIKMSMGFIVFNDFSPVAFIFFLFIFFNARHFSRVVHILLTSILLSSWR